MPFMGKATLYDAARAGDVKAVQKLGARTDVNAWNRDGVTALHFAVRHNHVKVVEALVQLGADPDRPAQTNSGSTPLQAAAFYGKADAVACLVRLGANVYSRGRHGRTALHLSAARGHMNVVQSLLVAGMDVNVVSGVGETPLSLAMQCGKHDIADWLLHNTNATPCLPADEVVMVQEGTSLPAHVAFDAELDNVLATAETAHAVAEAASEAAAAAWDEVVSRIAQLGDTPEATRLMADVEAARNTALAAHSEVGAKCEELTRQAMVVQAERERAQRMRDSPHLSGGLDDSTIVLVS